MDDLADMLADAASASIKILCRRLGRRWARIDFGAGIELDAVERNCRIEDWTKGREWASANGWISPLALRFAWNPPSREVLLHAERAALAIFQPFAKLQRLPLPKTFQEIGPILRQFRQKRAWRAFYAGARAVKSVLYNADREISWRHAQYLNLKRSGCPGEEEMFAAGWQTFSCGFPSYEERWMVHQNISINNDLYRQGKKLRYVFRQEKILTLGDIPARLWGDSEKMGRYMAAKADKVIFARLLPALPGQF